MASTNPGEAHLNFVLPPEVKATIEGAAAILGQSVDDFAISTLLEKSRTVLEGWSTKPLSDRDRDRLFAHLDDESRQPNAKLAAAAEEYKKWAANRAAE